MATGIEYFILIEPHQLPTASEAIPPLPSPPRPFKFPFHTDIDLGIFRVPSEIPQETVE